MTRLTEASGSTELAFSSAPGLLILGVGLVVVAVLAGVVWWDARRGRSRPPRPDEQPEPTGDAPAPKGRRPDDFGEEGERLGPHDLGGYGNQGLDPRPPDRKRRGRGGRRSRAE